MGTRTSIEKKRPILLIVVKGPNPTLLYNIGV